MTILQQLTAIQSLSVRIKSTGKCTLNVIRC